MSHIIIDEEAGRLILQFLNRTELSSYAEVTKFVEARSALMAAINHVDDEKALIPEAINPDDSDKVFIPEVIDLADFLPASINLADNNKAAVIKALISEETK